MANTQKANTKKVKDTKAMEEKILQQQQNLTETERQELEEKEKQLKTHYGIGGQVYSIFPILLDKAENPWLEEILAGIPARVSQQNILAWSRVNGTLDLVKVNRGGKDYYIILLLPKKEMEFQIWDLTWGMEPQESFLKYNKAERREKVKLTPENYLITNITTNRGKAIHQIKVMAKLLQLGYQDLEERAKITLKYTSEGLEEIGKNSGRPTGRKWKSLEELVGRKQVNQETLDTLLL